DYATALDALDTAPPAKAHFVAFSTDGATTLVAPLGANVSLAPGHPTTRITCAFWHTAERAASELADGVAVEDGTVAALRAVRFRALPDVALLEVLLDETVSTRTALDALGVEAEFELVEGVAVAFEAAAEPEAEAVAAAGGESSGAGLP